EIVESHAEACPSCAAELDDLRAFAGRRLPAWSRPVWLSAAAAAVIAIVALYAFQRSEPRQPTRTARVQPPTVRPAVGYGRADWDSLVANALRTGRVDVPADLRAFAAADAFRGEATTASPRVTVSPTATVI